MTQEHNSCFFCHIPDSITQNYIDSRLHNPWCFIKIWQHLPSCLHIPQWQKTEWANQTTAEPVTLPKHFLCHKLLCCVSSLINQSLPVYASANIAMLALCSYQLKESSQQSIIIFVPPCSLLRSHEYTNCLQIGVVTVVFTHRLC